LLEKKSLQWFLVFVGCMLKRLHKLVKTKQRKIQFYISLMASLQKFA